MIADVCLINFSRRNLLVGMILTNYNRQHESLMAQQNAEARNNDGSEVDNRKRSFKDSEHQSSALVSSNLIVYMAFQVSGFWNRIF